MAVKKPTKKKSTTKKTTPKSRRFDLDAALQGVPADAARQDPDMPADTFRKEADETHRAAVRNRAGLVALPGFNAAAIDDLGFEIEAFGVAQKAWDVERFRASGGSGRKSTRAEAEALRGKLLASARYVFRNEEAAVTELERISEGTGLPDLVTDLRDLVAFHAANAAAWSKDRKVTDKDVARAGELADLLDETADPESAIAAREHRNRVAALVEMHLREIREGARYLFREDPARLAPFLSRYQARKRALTRRNAAKKAPTG